jgi:Flp pilus assembly pilin Flp
MNCLHRLAAEDRGLETVEYAIISGLIVAGTLTAITAIAAWIQGRVGTLKTNLGA